MNDGQSTDTEPTNIVPINTESTDTEPTNIVPIKTESTNPEPINTEPINTELSGAQSTTSQTSAAQATTYQPSPPLKSRSKPRRRGVIGPLILITIGAVLLLANLGYISGSIWLTLIQFWPLILILAGLEILLGRTLIGQLVVLGIGLLAMGGVLWYLLNPTQVAFGGSLTTTPISQPIADVETANLDLNLGVGELKLGALDAGSADWIQGTISAPGNRQIKQESGVTSGVANLKISTQGTTVIFGNTIERWNLNLNPTIPVNLVVDAGVGSSTLDLNGLNIPRLDVNTGVGGLEVVMPAHAGTVSATLNGGVGGMTVYIPVGVPARIRSSTGIGGLTINQARFPNVAQDVYESPDYATAANRIDLSVDSGVGGITIP